MPTGFAKIYDKAIIKTVRRKARESNVDINCYLRAIRTCGKRGEQIFDRYYKAIGM